MPIKIHGLCGLTAKDGTLYALLPNFKTQGSTFKENPLYPHHTVVLLERDALTDQARQNIRYFTNRTLIENEQPVTKTYGVVLLDHETVSFTLNGNDLISENINEVSSNFIEMKKVYADSPNSVKLNTALLQGDITNSANTYNVDLTCRVAINKGTLDSEVVTDHFYLFTDMRVDDLYKEPKRISTRLNVDVEISEVRVGQRAFPFKSDRRNPIIWIENLPIIRMSLADAVEDHDFSLIYKLIPNIAAQNIRLPKVRIVHEEKPIICALAWFES